MSQEKIYDVAVVGCGPAGLSAAVNMKIRNMDFIIFGSEICSPRLHKAEKVNNYLGYFDITGEEMMDKFVSHAENMNISINQEKVDQIFNQGDFYTLVTRNETYNAYSLILALGVSNEKYLNGEEKLVGGGVSYCATCDGALYKGKDVAVVAYNEEGIEEAEYLSELVNKVYFVPMYDEFDEDIEGDNVEIIQNKVVAINGENKVESLELEGKEIDVDGVFIFRQVTPPDKLMFGLELEGPHIKVDGDMAANFPGVFAAGDCTGVPYQLSRAVGQGQVAGLNASSYARKKRREMEEKKNEDKEMMTLNI
ncbi:MAG: NAD(P)/FAD-dependent oxidoreductase [Halothermotrichaceae bacterium]